MNFGRLRMRKDQYGGKQKHHGDIPQIAAAATFHCQTH
jgi:hypothetical protein